MHGYDYYLVWLISLSVTISKSGFLSCGVTFCDVL